MYAGIDPCHAAGTDIDPTSRALPSPAVAMPKAPNPPPANGCKPVNALLALCGALGGAPVAPTNAGDGDGAGAGAAVGPALWASVAMGVIIAVAAITVFVLFCVMFIRITTIAGHRIWASYIVLGLIFCAVGAILYSRRGVPPDA